MFLSLAENEYSPTQFWHFILEANKPQFWSHCIKTSSVDSNSWYLLNGLSIKSKGIFVKFPSNLFFHGRIINLSFSSRKHPTCISLRSELTFKWNQLHFTKQGFTITVINNKLSPWIQKRTYFWQVTNINYWDADCRQATHVFQWKHSIPTIYIFSRQQNSLKDIYNVDDILSPQENNCDKKPQSK